MDEHRRFLDKIQLDPATACWVWTATTNQKGYGRFWADMRLQSAHRWSYEHHVGPIATDMLVCHRCDNPPCCNPDHLFLGSQVDNKLDSQRKGRDTTSGTGVSKYIGVTLHAQTVAGRRYAYWRARINVNGRQVWLGQYPTEQQAARAYNDYVTHSGIDKPINDLAA